MKWTSGLDCHGAAAAWAVCKPKEHDGIDQTVAMSI